MIEEQAIDCVSRQAVKEGMIKYGFRAPDMTVTEFIEDELLSVTPKIPTSDDCVSRQAVLDLSDFVGTMPTIDHYGDTLEEVVSVEKIEALPSVTPTHGVCKDCKHFHSVRKDFNVCDLWTIACTDNHYCADFEKRGDSDDSN